MSTRDRRIRASIAFTETDAALTRQAADQPQLQLEAGPAEDARRLDLVRRLALSGALSDERLLSLVFGRLGAAALSDEALGLLGRLEDALASERGHE